MFGDKEHQEAIRDSQSSVPNMEYVGMLMFLYLIKSIRMWNNRKPFL